MTSIKAKFTELNKMHSRLFAAQYKKDNTLFDTLICPTKITSQSKIIGLNESRKDLAVPKSVDGWIKKINNNLNYRNATPKNKKWYDEHYVFPDSHPETFSEWSKKQGCFNSDYIDENENCIKCVRGYDDDMVYYPNCSKKCLDIFLDNIKNAAVDATQNKRIEESRYLLTGKAGEGKTAFLNYIFSSYQDYFWENKIINIKVSLTRTDILDSYIPHISSHQDERKKIINNWVYLKVIRMLKKWYFSSVTSINIFNKSDFDNLLKIVPPDFKNTLICKERLCKQSRSYFLEYHSGKMDNATTSRLIAAHPDNQLWAEYIHKLSKKSQATLCKKEVNRIMTRLKDSFGVDSFNDERFWLLRGELDKDVTTKVDEDIVLNVVKQMNDLGYYFWIVIDGADPHQRNNKNEIVIRRLCYDIMNILFMSNIPRVPGAYLVAMREETVERQIVSFDFHGSQWGRFKKFQIAPVRFCEILSPRLSNASETVYQQTLAHNFINFSSKLFYAALTGSILVDNQHFDEVDRKGFPLMTILFKRNRRKMLNFFKLFIQEVFTGVRKIGVDIEKLERQEEKSRDTAIDNAIIYFSRIKSHYYFWNPIIYRSHVLYIPLYTTELIDIPRRADITDDNGVLEQADTIDEDIASEHEEIIDENNESLERILIGEDTDYLTVPNIFNRIIPASLNNNINLLMLKFVLLRILERGTCRYDNLVTGMSEYYRVHESHIKHEIDELIFTGFISTKDFISTLNLKENPELRTTIFWDHYKKWFFSIEVFSGICADIVVENRFPFTYSQYCTFVSRNSELLKHRKDRTDWFSRTRDAHASTFIVGSLMISFLKLMNIIERGRYNNNKQILQTYIPNIEHLSYGSITMREMLKKLELEFHERADAIIKTKDIKSINEILESQITDINQWLNKDTEQNTAVTTH